MKTTDQRTDVIITAFGEHDIRLSKCTQWDETAQGSLLVLRGTTSAGKCKIEFNPTFDTLYSTERLTVTIEGTDAHICMIVPKVTQSLIKYAIKFIKDNQ